MVKNDTKIYKEKVSDRLWLLYDKPKSTRPRQTLAEMIKGRYGCKTDYYWRYFNPRNKQFEHSEGWIATQKECINDLIDYLAEE